MVAADSARALPAAGTSSPPATHFPLSPEPRTRSSCWSYAVVAFQANNAVPRLQGVVTLKSPEERSPNSLAPEGWSFKCC